MSARKLSQRPKTRHPEASPGAFTGIDRAQRSRQVRDQLEGAITRGDYGPGDRLPSERELTEMFGVSRVSVREAIGSLETLGLVDVQHGRGCFVAPGRAENYTVPFRHWLGVHRADVLELLRVRGALDELAAEIAAVRGDEAAIAAVKTAHEEFRAAALADVPVERLVKLDIAFHEAVAEANDGKLLANLLGDLNTSLHESRYAALAARGRSLQSANEHERIVRAIVAGRPAEARAAVAQHIKAVEVAVVELTAAQDGGQPVPKDRGGGAPSRS
ncbi:MAG: FadR/GntR family transcriptional regulator [Microbacterium sp.]